MPAGGKRTGAGRKQGILAKRTRAIAEKASAMGISPLEVMLDNMRHFQQVALDAEAVIESMNEEQIVGLGQTHEEQFKALLAKVKQAAGLRLMAHECARDAAPFIHAKLSAVEHSGQIGIRNASDVSDDELASIAAGSGEGTSKAPFNSQKLN